MLLDDLPNGAQATVCVVVSGDPVVGANALLRLAELGFIAGALVEPAATSHMINQRRLQLNLDGILMHPVRGLAILAALLFVIFQAVFSWATVPMDSISTLMEGVAQWTLTHMSNGLMRSLLVDGIIAGVGGVFIFLPQLLILFFFIL